ncbi:MAG: acyl-CoA dehydrogenase, partial [Thermus sp.]
GTGSFAVTYGAHAGIGTLPVVFFGTDDQRRRYLPGLAAGTLVAAYALTEPGAGSDAMAIRTRAARLPDGRFRLEGAKQFITNAGFADLFTVYAKVDGEAFTAFLVERQDPGLLVGAEEAKLGIHGASTCPVTFDGTIVGPDRVLGEIGRGYRVAFNILNVGRFKLAAACLGAMRPALATAVAYASERRAFGRPIAAFPLVAGKLAGMATRIYAVESLVYQLAGLVDARLAAAEAEAAGEAGAQAQDGAQEGAREAYRRALEEYAVECSIAKVFASEALDRVVDELVQIHGGYGYVESYPAARAYRDARINRIWEGTNEINRLLIPGMLLRRAMKGHLPLFQAAQRLQKELLEPSFEEPEDREAAYVQNLKKLALMVMGLAALRFGEKVEEEQEVLAAAADILIETYAAESGLLRARRLGGVAQAMARFYLLQALDRAQVRALGVLPRLAEGDELRLALSAARRLTKREALDLVAIRREVAQAVLEREGYPLAVLK